MDKTFNWDIELQEYVSRQMAKHAQELVEDKIGRMSRYNGISRVNCSDGYVDVRATASTPVSVRLPMNGYPFGGTVDTCRSHFRSLGLGIYNYNHK